MTPQSSTELYARLLSYVRPYARTFALAVLGMVAAAATEPLFPALIKPLLDGGFGARVPSTPPIVFAGRFSSTPGHVFTVATATIS